MEWMAGINIGQNRRLIHYLPFVPILYSLQPCSDDILHTLTPTLIHMQIHRKNHPRLSRDTYSCDTIKLLNFYRQSPTPIDLAMVCCAVCICAAPATYNAGHPPHSRVMHRRERLGCVKSATLQHQSNSELVNDDRWVLQLCTFNMIPRSGEDKKYFIGTGRVYVEQRAGDGAAREHGRTR